MAGPALVAAAVGLFLAGSRRAPALAPPLGSGPVSSSPGGTLPAGLPKGSPGAAQPPGAPSGGPPGGPPGPRGLAPPFPFPGRPDVLALAGGERGQGDAPASRDAVIAHWLRTGRLDPITWIRVPVRGGLEVDASADLVSLGGVRLCCSMRAAQWVADAHGAMLITAAISDAIWRASTLRIAPFSLSSPSLYGFDPGGAVRFWLEEQDGIERALAAAKSARLQREGMRAVFAGPPDLLATLSKDYVLDHRLVQQPTKCAIYGWHQLNGVPIQSRETGASFIHELSFFDYSHGVRIVRDRAWLNGQPVALADIYRQRPELVTYQPGYPAPPVRHPAIPPFSFVR